MFLPATPPSSLFRNLGNDAPCSPCSGREDLLVILVLLLVGALPTLPHSSNWGYFPSGGLGLVVVILFVLLPMERI